MAGTGGARRELPGEVWVVVGGLGLGAASIVPWYDPGELALDATRTNGWQEPDAFLSQAATVVGVAVAVLVLLAGRQLHRPGAGASWWGTLLTWSGAATLGLVALKLALNLDGTTVGVYLALVAASMQLYGGYVTRMARSETAGSPTLASPAAAAQPVSGGQPPARQPTTPLQPQPPPPPAPSPAPHPTATRPQAEVQPTQVAPQEARPDPPAQVAQVAPRPDLPAQVAQVAPQGAAPAVPAGWPETAYFLATWLQPAPDVEPAAAQYLRTFGSDTARLARLGAELVALVDPGRSDGELDALLAGHAPRWAGRGGRQVLARAARALSPGGHR